MYLFKRARQMRIHFSMTNLIFASKRHFNDTFSQQTMQPQKTITKQQSSQLEFAWNGKEPKYRKTNTSTANSLGTQKATINHNIVARKMLFCFFYFFVAIAQVYSSKRGSFIQFFFFVCLFVNQFDGSRSQSKNSGKSPLFISFILLNNVSMRCMYTRQLPLALTVESV